MSNLETPAASLRQFYSKVFKPSLLRRSVCKSYLEIHEFAVARFEMFFGRDQPLPEISEQMLLDFEAYIWRVAPSEERHRVICESLRRIVSTYEPNLRQNRRVRMELPFPPNGSLRHFFETVYVSHRLVGRREKTADEYRSSLVVLFQHYKRDLLLSEMSDTIAADHFQWLLDHGRTAATVNRIRAGLFTIWRYAHELGHCEKVPRLKKLPEQRRAPEAWSREELEYIIQACTCLAGTKHRNIPSDVYWDALLRVEYYTALRRRALFGLRKEHFDLGQGILRVPPGLMKTNSGKKFKIGSDAVRSLERLWPYVQERIFPFEENHFRRIYDQFYEILTAAGVKRSTAHANVFHQLRRSTATIVADSRGNAAAAQLLGHLGEVTIQRYIDQTKVQALDLSEVLIPLPEASGNSSPNAEQSRKSREFATTRPRVRQTLQTAGSMKDPFE